MGRTASFGCSASSSLEKRCWLPGDGVQEWKASSSIGRAADSKSAGWGFDSLLACHSLLTNGGGGELVGGELGSPEGI